MLIFGVCGGSGSGKSFVCQQLSSHRIPTLNTDNLYHDMIATDSDCSRALIAAFGDDIANWQNGIDREKLKQIVFAPDSHEKRLILNKIAHKYIRIETLKWIDNQRQNGFSAITIDAPLLFESEFDQMCDYIIAVIAPMDIRIQRICLRDHILPEEALKRISFQIPDDELIKRSHFYIINDSKKSVTTQIRDILTKLNIEP